MVKRSTCQSKMSPIGAAHTPMRRPRLVGGAAKRRAAAAAATAASRLSGEEMDEMRRLAGMLPSGARISNPHNDPLTLINEAARYIGQLSSTLVARVQNGSLSPGECDDRFVCIRQFLSSDVLKQLPIVLSDSTAVSSSPSSRHRVSTTSSTASSLSSPIFPSARPPHVVVASSTPRPHRRRRQK